MELLEKLGIDPLLLAAQAVNFLILLFVLKRFLYKPIVNVLEKRRNKIKDSLEKADKIEKDAQRAEEIKQEKIELAEKEARKIIESAKKTAEKLKARITEETKQESEKMVQKAKQEIQMEKEKLTKELRKEVGNLVLLSTNKIIGKTLDDATHKKLVDEVIKEIK